MLASFRHCDLSSTASVATTPMVVDIPASRRCGKSPRASAAAVCAR